MTEQINQKAHGFAEAHRQHFVQTALAGWVLRTRGACCASHNAANS